MKLVDQTVFIDAPPSDVYALLTRAELLVEWMAPVARVEPRPGGEITWTHLNGGTELHLVHRGLEGPMADAHHGGWANYLHRLATRAAGHDPGPDPLAAEHVPTRSELGLP